MDDGGTLVDDDGTLVDVVDVEPEPTDANDDTTTDDEVEVEVDGTTVDVVLDDVTGTEVDVVLDDVDVELEEVLVVDDVLDDATGTLVVVLDVVEVVLVDDATGTLDVEDVDDVDDDVLDVVDVDDVLDDVVLVDVVLVDGNNAGSHTPGRPNVTDSTGPANDGGTTNNGTPTAAATSNATRNRKPPNMTSKNYRQRPAAVHPIHHKTQRKREIPEHTAPGFQRWWRGWDLNPRPSGYENRARRLHS